MFKKGPVPAFVHGLLEYAAGVLFLVAPFLLDFEENAATAASIVAGVLILAFTASTAMSTGLIKSIPVQAHVVIDYVLAIALIAAPFVLGFSGDGAATAFFMALGVLYLLLTIATRFIREERPRRRARARARARAHDARDVDTRRVPADPLAPHAASPAELARAARRRARRHPVPGPPRSRGPAAHRPALRHARRRRTGRGQRGRAAVGSRGLAAARRARAGRRALARVRRPALAQRNVRQRRAAARAAPAPVRRRTSRAGGTQLAFVAPEAGAEDATRTADRASRCGGGHAGAEARPRSPSAARCATGGAPASNREIADELVLALDTVKGVLSRLFEAFGIGAEVPQNQKRPRSPGARSRSAWSLPASCSGIDPRDAAVALPGRVHVAGAGGHRVGVATRRERLGPRPRPSARRARRRRGRWWRRRTRARRRRRSPPASAPRRW